MSGSGRKSHYRKSVTDEYLNSFPEPEEGDQIVLVKGSRGTNIFEVQLPDGKEDLALMPSKFKKLIWVKRGDYLIVSGVLASDLEGSGSDSSKVHFVIKNILTYEQISNIHEQNKW